MSRLVKMLGLSDIERIELNRLAVLSEAGRAMKQFADKLTGVDAALSILEMSVYLSQAELKAIETLIEGYRYRAHTPGVKII